MILKGLGGIKNIEDIDCCATRLRITVTDETKVTDQYLKQSGSKGIIKKGTGIQIIYGPQVSVIKSMAPIAAKQGAQSRLKARKE